MIKRVEVPKLLNRKPGNERDLVLAMICSASSRPVPSPARAERQGSRLLLKNCTSKGRVLGALYAAMDWLLKLKRSEGIQQRLARRHLRSRPRPADIEIDSPLAFVAGRRDDRVRLAVTMIDRRAPPGRIATVQDEITLARCPAPSA